MQKEPHEHPDGAEETSPARGRGEQKFKKLIRPIHTTRRGSTPARMRGMHRRRRRRMGW